MVALAAALLAGGCAGTVVRTQRPPDVVTGATAAPAPIGELRLSAPDHPFAPTFLAVDATGRLLVTDSSRGRVAVYSSDGGQLVGYLEPPSAASGSAGRLQDVRGIAISRSGLTIYVLDAGAGRLYGWDLGLQLSGIALDATDPALTARFGRLEPQGLALEPTGGALLSDRVGDRVLAFDPQWRPDKEIGGPGSRCEGLFDPGAIGIDSSGNLAVADRGNRMLALIDVAGRFAGCGALPRAPESVVADPRGGFLVGDSGGDVYRVVAGEARLLLTAPPGEGGPAYLALSPHGDRLYVARPGSGRIVIYAWGGEGAPP